VGEIAVPNIVHSSGAMLMRCLSTARLKPYYKNSNVQRTSKPQSSCRHTVLELHCAGASSTCYLRQRGYVFIGVS